MTKFEDFKEKREQQNKLLVKYANKEHKTFYGLDAKTYAPGHLDKKTKELLGFVASLVLRCDDCITYHLDACKEADVTSEELSEAVSIGMLVGGSITIPHIRRAMEAWDEGQENS